MFRRKIISIIIICALVIWALVGISPVAAQTPGQALPNDSTEYEPTKAQLLSLYSNQVQSYQTVYRRYSLATVQYDKLLTLTALGELVNATKETMLKRGDVLVSYIDILYLELRFTQNIDPKIKQDLLRRLEDFHDAFLNQQVLITNSQDYQAINERAATFEKLIIDFEPISIETKVAINKAKITVADETSRVFYQQVSDYYQKNPVSGFQAVERQRAKEEIDKAFSQLSDLWTEFDKLGLKEKQKASQSWYSQVLKSLNSLQNQLLIIYSYLEEASRL